MLALAHTVSSAALASFIPNAPLAFVTGIILHFAEDSILHWNFYPHKHKHIKILASFDLMSGIALTYLLLGTDSFLPNVLAGVAGGLLPDILSAASNMFRVPFVNPGWFEYLHANVQKETEVVWIGLIGQVITLAVSVYVIYTFR